jgi:peroxiredoxin
MMMRRVVSVFLGSVFVAGICMLASCAVAEQAELKVGDKAPDWKNLIGVDDKQHSLSDYKDAKVIVLVFTCNHCPVAKAYEDRLIALQKDYQEKGVQVIALNVNNIPEDRLDRMKVRAKEKGFNFPYLYDPTQATGHAYGAKVTPHVFVMDSERKIAYVGAIDDNMDVSKVKRNYLRDALDALLANKTPETAMTKAFGCSIKYE